MTTSFSLRIFELWGFKPPRRFWKVFPRGWDGLHGRVAFCGTAGGPKKLIEDDWLHTTKTQTRVSAQNSEKVRPLAPPSLPRVANPVRSHGSKAYRRKGANRSNGVPWAVAKCVACDQQEWSVPRRRWLIDVTRRCWGYEVSKLNGYVLKRLWRCLKPPTRFAGLGMCLPRS